MATPTSYTPLNVDAAHLTTSVATYLTSAGLGYQLTSIIVTNVTATSATLELYLVPSGGTAGISNALAYLVPIPADGLPHEILLTNGQVFLESGGTVQAKAGTATALTIHISYVALA